MASIEEVQERVERILTRVPEAEGRASGFVQRAAPLTPRVFVLTLVLGWLGNPRASLAELARTAGRLGVRISAQGLDQRFTEGAAELLRRVVATAAAEVVAAGPVAVPLLGRFTAVEVQDTTTVALPDALKGVWRGCGERTGKAQAALKLLVRWDLLTGRLTGPFLAPGREQDRACRLQTEPLAPGSLRLADLGFFSLRRFRGLSARRAHWLSRLQARTNVFTRAGDRLDLVGWLGGLTVDTVDVPVVLGAAVRLPARLLACRVPPEVAAERRRRLLAEAAHKSQPVSEERLALADWTILVTDLGPERLTLAEALVLARLRWQVELLFKLWKQAVALESSTSQDPWRILCEVYAKLLALLAEHWILLTAAWDQPDRSLVQAAQVVRQHAALLVAGFAGRFSLAEVLAYIAEGLGACRLTVRRGRPSAAQLARAPDRVLAPPEPPARRRAA